MKHLLILLISLFFISCSQKTPNIDGKNGRFTHHFYPALVESSLLSNDTDLPLIFLYEGYYGEWRDNKVVSSLRKLGYNVVTIGYYDASGISNNLTQVNLNALKEVMDGYKNNYRVNKDAIGVLGRGKGAELALVMGSLYDDIKMVVALTTTHVVMQSPQINLAHHSSWVHDGKEMPFVPFPLASLETIKGAVILLFEGKGYYDIHMNAFKNQEAMKKARIEVEKINGPLLVVANSNDDYFPSCFAGEQISKQLKEKNFSFPYEYKVYDNNWYMSNHKKEWNDVYAFLVKNFSSPFVDIKFNQADKNADKKISLEEYIPYRNAEIKKKKKRSALEIMYNCDKNHDGQVDFYEVKNAYQEVTPLGEDSVYIADACTITRENFYYFDQDKSKVITQKELDSMILKSNSASYYHETSDDGKKYLLREAQRKLTQCDLNGDKQIDQEEAKALSCQIPSKIFELIDADKNNVVNDVELVTIPEKYHKLRHPFYPDDINRSMIITSELPYINLYNCDKNRDHALNEDEATGRNCGFTHEEFIKHDLNKDGLFSDKDRTYRSMQERIKWFDLDKDGYLNALEFMLEE